MIGKKKTRIEKGEYNLHAYRKCNKKRCMRDTCKELVIQKEIQ